MPADPKLVQDLFLRLAELPLADREAALDLQCAGDDALRLRVAALLKAHDAPDSYLDQSGSRLAGTEITGPAPAELDAAGRPGPAPAGSQSSLPQQVPPTVDYRSPDEPGITVAGRYNLVQKIGEGGMGEVWVARQTEPVKRKVALKLIKTGMDSKAVLQRFEQERQALGLMDHPHIARVLDGGMTATGQPYFVMELVNGLSLVKFCDELKLTPRERLELFVPICQAVQHAHQKGIVHRDLKPANILVTMIDGRPVPKVIDFGVAKATAGKLTEESMSTGFGAVVGTLEYMSPEQAAFSGEDIDTRADIYSLGVILYELLTGLRPIDARRLKQAALAEMIRIIQEEEPSKPSTRLSTDEGLPSLAALRQTEPKRLTALLRGELDCVVMKCLEKQRDRRYETASALARDVQRYLANELVEARPPTAAYRLRKFVRRNRALVVGIVAAAIILPATLILIGIAVVSQSERVKAVAAERRATEAEKTAQEQRDKALVAHRYEAVARAEAQRARNEAIEAEKMAIEARDVAIKAEHSAVLARQKKEYEADIARIGQAEAQIRALLPDVKFSDEVLRYLEQQVRIHHEVLQSTLALSNQGRRGGEAQNVAQTEDLYHSSRARLKWAQGELAECLTEYEAAVAAAERRVSALAAIDGEAEVPADGELKIVAARGRVAELKICAERVGEALCEKVEGGK